MRAKKVTVPREALLDPVNSAWQSQSAEVVRLQATPLAKQPSVYIKATWKNRPYGKVKQVSVRAVCSGDDIFFHLDWADSTQNLTIKDINVFPDGAGVLFPTKGDAPITTMGSEEKPVNGWQWRADWGDKGRNNIARGLGTTEMTEKSQVTTRSVWRDGHWYVVIARPLKTSAGEADGVQLEPGKTAKVGFAVWEGGSGERAGIKAFSGNWRPLIVEA